MQIFQEQKIAIDQITLIEKSIRNHLIDMKVKKMRKRLKWQFIGIKIYEHNYYKGVGIYCKF